MFRAESDRFFLDNHFLPRAMDLRIAAIVIANQMTLLTRNTVDFERVPNLAFEDWTIPKGD